MNLDGAVSSFPIVAAAVLGLLIGSFLNVCIYRIPRDLSVVKPRSFCPGCGITIPWYRNIPVISFAVLRGRCANCSEPIGWRYPLVEGATALLFALLASRYGVSLSWCKWATFEGVCVLLFWTDLETRLLVDEGTLGGLVCGLFFAFLLPVPMFFGLWVPFNNAVVGSLLEASLSALCMSGLLFGARSAFRRLRGKEGLGLGDVKLVAMFGAFAGLQGSIWILMMAALLGSGIGLLYILLTRKDASTYQLPFGSFLCAAGALWPLLPGATGV